MRDKSTALRQRGMWMGGMPPLGYDVIERKLIANPAVSLMVKAMFSRSCSLARPVWARAMSDAASGRC